MSFMEAIRRRVIRQANPALVPDPPPQGLLARVCPSCGVTASSLVMCLREDQFTPLNGTYRVDRLREVGLPADFEYPIVRCDGCGVVYTRYCLDAEKERFVYSELIDREASYRKILTQQRRILDLEIWLAVLKGLPDTGGALNLRVADYGCGWGTVLQTARSVGVDVVGFDVTPWKVEWARQQGLPICTDYESLVAAGPFDLCLSTSVIEHMPDPVATVREITNILRPGGFAYITGIVRSVETAEGWEAVKRLAREGKPFNKNVNPWEHLNYFSWATLDAVVRKAGLDLHSQAASLWRRPLPREV